MSTTIGERLDTMTGRRSAAMHAKGHAYYRTNCPEDCGHAARWAARRLITPTRFLAAAKTHGRIADLATDLAVTPADVLAYLDALSEDEVRIMLRLVGRP